MDTLRPITAEDKKTRNGLFGDNLGAGTKDKSKILAEEDGDHTYNGRECPVCDCTERIVGTVNDGGCINCKRKSQADYKKRTPAKHAAQNAKRRAQKLDQTPPDTDFKKIEEIYEEARRLQEETGEPHHVDHIIPISKGGLHHQDNLEPLTAEANLRKGAKII
ncbi:hypothetical protein LCGC14_3087400 [marine sediment metagenome]|uniref:HNH nuclease domain-containing protein n=1 Tax=marine sediment metagenome TaxID=412755 RepID=A0A0F8WC46_9ZZZZ